MSLLLLLANEAIEAVAQSIAYILNGVTIRSPHKITESNSTQYAQNRVLEGDINRDFFGDNKRVWSLDYRNLNKADYDEIKTLYELYLQGSSLSWSITGDNYAVAATNVHVELKQKQMDNTGPHYLSNFRLILYEV